MPRGSFLIRSTTNFKRNSLHFKTFLCGARRRRGKSQTLWRHWNESNEKRFSSRKGKREKRNFLNAFYVRSPLDIELFRFSRASTDGFSEKVSEEVAIAQHLLLFFSALARVAIWKGRRQPKCTTSVELSWASCSLRIDGAFFIHGKALRNCIGASLRSSGLAMKADECESMKTNTENIIRNHLVAQFDIHVSLFHDPSLFCFMILHLGTI